MRKEKFKNTVSINRNYVIILYGSKTHKISKTTGEAELENNSHLGVQIHFMI